MKIVFWNTARGSSMISERFSMILENCVALAHGKPELIVLCELLKGSRKIMREQGGLPGYTFIKPSKVFGGYTDQNTLRYVILARNDATCWAHYVDTGTDRPVLHITINGIALMAIHAPSVTDSVKPQSRALGRGFLNGAFFGEPVVIFGDFNVNAYKGWMRTDFTRRVEDQLKGMFQSTTTLTPKYDQKRPTRPKSGKALDWALVNSAWASHVTVSVMETDSSDRSVDWFDSSDDEFVPEIISTGKSDHEAILIDIS